jgi:hypothetical protein
LFDDSVPARPVFLKSCHSFFLSFGDASRQSFKEWLSREHFKHFVGEKVDGILTAAGGELVRDFLALLRVVLLLERPRSFPLEKLRS